VVVLGILLKRQRKTGRTTTMKRGTVFIAEHSEPRDDLVDRIRAQGGDDSWVTSGDMSYFTGQFHAHWEPDDDDSDEFRQGPEHVSAEEAIAWGRSQADVVLIRVGNGEFGGNEAGYFSAGVRHLDDVPAWPEGGLEISPRPEDRRRTGVALDEGDARQALDKVVAQLRQLSYAQLRKRITSEYPRGMREGFLTRAFRRARRPFREDHLAIVSGSHNSERKSAGPSGNQYRVLVQMDFVGLGPNEDIRIVAWVDDHEYDAPAQRVEHSYVVTKPQ
jgi:hypothetical protein